MNDFESYCISEIKTRIKDDFADGTVILNNIQLVTHSIFYSFVLNFNILGYEIDQIEIEVPRVILETAGINAGFFKEIYACLIKKLIENKMIWREDKECIC